MRMTMTDRSNPYQPPGPDGARAAAPRRGILAYGFVAQFLGFGFALGALVVLYLGSILGYERSRGLVPWGIASGTLGGLLLLFGIIPTILEIRSKLRELEQLRAELKAGRP